ncbi:Lon protease family protein [Halonatronum saccharophilum]|uniref:Lon protease family protein n=1 Tax=Halonatronum saccharophilum TaxID=150060 RepID=UPI000489955D|nr:AAA family ATPase [Halonatronum saccharophilum]
MKDYRLVPSDLIKRCSLDDFSCIIDEELKGYREIIGQKRGLKAMDLGLNIHKEGYNIFVVNFAEKKELEYLVSLIKKKARKREKAYDLLYAYDFNNHRQAKLLKLPGGLGRKFKGELEESLLKVKEDLKRVFSSDDYLKEKRRIKDKLHNKRKEMIDNLKSRVEAMGYSLEKERAGFSIIPYLEDGEPMSEDYYLNLPKEEQDNINSDTEEIQNMLDETLYKVELLQEEAEKKIGRLNWVFLVEVFKDNFGHLYEKYSQFDGIVEQLKQIRDDIFSKLKLFIGEEDEGGSLFSFEEKGDRDLLKNYKVNLIVDNSGVEGGPVVFVDDPTYYNLCGKIEYISEDGNLVSIFDNIKGGAIHKANGGYLILKAKDLLTNFKSWHLLKKVLKSKKLRIGNLGEDFDKIPLATLEAEEVEVDLKVIILGDLNFYNLLYYYDNDFKELFKVQAYFDKEVERSKENVFGLIEFIKRECKDEDILALDKGSVAKVIEYASRRSGSKTMLSTSLNSIVQILTEANLWANKAGKDLITEVEIKKAIKEREERASFYEDKLKKMYDEGKILVDTEGEKIGEINGLSVLEIGDYSFGRPTKITSAVYKGNKGVVNIESETKMSGKIHNKGVMTLIGYLGERYAQKVPLSLSASLSFEQLYSSIDGDSASSAELYVLLSSLAKVPIKQSIAVTGSINQKGLIQPVGGINQKIEGFFDLCNRRGLNGDEGVIIPIQNVDNLMLKDEVIQAVSEGKFNIWAITKLEEGIKLLMGKEAGEKLEDGSYPPGTINHLVQSRIEELAQKD